MNTGPIFIVDDDSDDHEFIESVWKELPFENQLLFFDSGEEVLNHLKTNQTVPFLIISDVKLPKMDGFELKKRIQEDFSLRYKSIPFVFWSGQVSREQIKKAYDLGVNGFFIKENKLSELKKSFSTIMEYWFRSQVPEQ